MHVNSWPLDFDILWFACKWMYMSSHTYTCIESKAMMMLQCATCYLLPEVSSLLLRWRCQQLTFLRLGSSPLHQVSFPVTTGVVYQLPLWLSFHHLSVLSYLAVPLHQFVRICIIINNTADNLWEHISLLTAVLAICEHILLLTVALTICEGVYLNTEHQQSLRMCLLTDRHTNNLWQYIDLLTWHK